jgi:hypothetical protein
MSGFPHSELHANRGPSDSAIPQEKIAIRAAAVTRFVVFLGR